MPALLADPSVLEPTPMLDVMARRWYLAAQRKLIAELTVHSEGVLDVSRVVFLPPHHRIRTPVVPTRNP